MVRGAAGPEPVRLRGDCGLSRVLGVACTSSCAYLAFVQAGAVAAIPDRLEWPAGEESERLGELFQDTQGLLREQEVTCVAILLPERGGSFQRGYFLLAPRVSLETVIRLAAVAVGIPIALIERTTVRAALGCGRAGGLETHLDRVIPQPVGRYWRQGRGLAAMAALAAERTT